MRLVLSTSVLLLAGLVAGCNRGPDPSAPATQRPSEASPQPAEEFLRLMNAGRTYYEQGDATNAVATYRKAVALVPNDADARLNLANAWLTSGAAAEAVQEADEVLKLEPNSAAAYFVKGSALLRLSRPEEAVKALENARRIEPGVTATSFQLGLARTALKQWDEAIAAFREGIALDPNRLHTAAHYLLGQALLRAGRENEAQQELLQHQAALEQAGPALGAATFERSKYTQPRVPFRLEQPETVGIKVTFQDATAEVLGENAANFSGPLGILDPHHSGWNCLFAAESTNGFRLLWNSNGVFRAHGPLYPAVSGATYSKTIVGDLQNDRFEDVVVLGNQASHLFAFATNGIATDLSKQSRLHTLGAVDGALIDLDFTGKLDLLAVSASNDVRLFRQFGPLLFSEITSTSGIPASLQNARALAMVDWNRDEITDVIVSRTSDAPLLLDKERGGPLVPRGLTNSPSAATFCAGDFDNDLRPDLALVADGRITIRDNRGDQTHVELGSQTPVHLLTAFDYDNDGWLDLWVAGETLRVWRNLGLSGFQERTRQLGLDGFGRVAEIHFADFDRDCDSDAIVALAGGGLRYLRNQGGNANAQVKVQLVGNRSNASGIGCKVEIQTGGLRLLRTVRQLPVEIGVGKHQVLDSFVVHWFNWPQGSAEVPFNCREPLLALELTIQEGSCPYLYAWDGKEFRFITDILGAAPLGLPLAESRYIEADPEEIVWVGNEETFAPRNGSFQLQITEELREALYLDEARLVVVDHEPGAEVHSTDKLLPGPPFPAGTLLTLHGEQPLRRAETVDGQDATPALLHIDGHRLSPPKLRSPQLRGLTEPHGVILDFGPLDTAQPLVLVLNGWLRFGGGMANIAASQDPSLPFPFPALEAETAPGEWRPIDVVAGAPAGKTKTILVDLDGKLPANTRRLRLTQAFEIHWDRIALLEKKPDALTRITFLSPSEADLHFRGFSALRDLPPDWPLTPDYNTVSPNYYWTIIPGGWCTRYGDVLELLATRDEALAIINAGDELTLSFSSASLPAKPPGTFRQFFLYVDGWDKDSDFHVAAGTQVDPLPFHGMDYQNYGRQSRPAFSTDALHRKYNTRWVEPKALRQISRR